MTAAPGFSAPFRRILVGWDCSPGAATALQAAAAIATDVTAQVVVLAVLTPAPQTEEAADGVADFDGRREHARQTFAKALHALSGTQRERVTLRFAESGDAAGAVCEYARERGFDLLVLGKHGTGGVLHPRLGHVAATAVRKSNLPVLLTA
jgi:nucleotide-binding universal stress UspA family protein